MQNGVVERGVESGILPGQQNRAPPPATFRLLTNPAGDRGPYSLGAQRRHISVRMLRLLCFTSTFRTRPPDSTTGLDHRTRPHDCLVCFLASTPIHNPIRGNSKQDARNRNRQWARPLLQAKTRARQRKRLPLILCKRTKTGGSHWTGKRLTPRTLTSASEAGVVGGPCGLDVVSITTSRGDSHTTGAISPTPGHIGPLPALSGCILSSRPPFLFL
jgi:hypothetical protein